MKKTIAINKALNYIEDLRLTQDELERLIDELDSLSDEWINITDLEEDKMESFNNLQI